MPNHDPYTALEKRTEIQKALTLWKSKVQDGAVIQQNRPGLNGTTFVHSPEGFWVHFGVTPSKTVTGWRPWNPLGKVPAISRQHMLVEINPPEDGIAKGVQGLFAKSADGDVWLMHGGRLHPPGKRINAMEFEEESKLRPVSARRALLRAAQDWGCGAPERQRSRDRAGAQRPDNNHGGSRAREMEAARSRALARRTRR